MLVQVTIENVIAHLFVVQYMANVPSYFLFLEMQRKCACKFCG